MNLKYKILSSLEQWHRSCLKATYRAKTFSRCKKLSHVFVQLQLKVNLKEVMNLQAKNEYKFLKSLRTLELIRQKLITLNANILTNKKSKDT